MVAFLFKSKYKHGYQTIESSNQSANQPANQQKQPVFPFILSEKVKHVLRKIRGEKENNNRNRNIITNTPVYTIVGYTSTYFSERIWLPFTLMLGLVFIW